MELLSIFCDTILPGDKSLRLPSAADLDVKSRFLQIGKERELTDYFNLIEEIAIEEFGLEFAKLEASQRLKIVEKSKRKNIRLATAVIVECIKVYYTSSQVLKNIPAGAIPPFPEGNQLDDDDWSLLDSVYERGPIYRSVDE